MRHKRVGRKLGVTSKHRKSMFRNMATDLLRHDRIKTSDVRAKEIRRVVEKLITLAKKGTLESRRKAEGFIRDKEVVKKLFTELAEKFKDRPGGYTRIIKLGYRRGDNTPISLIELIEEDYKPKKKKRKSKPKAKKVEKTTDESAKSSKKESAEDLGLVETAAAAKAAEEVAEKVEESKEVETETKEQTSQTESIDSENTEEPVNVEASVPEAKKEEDPVETKSEEAPEEAKEEEPKISDSEDANDELKAEGTETEDTAEVEEEPQEQKPSSDEEE